VGGALLLVGGPHLLERCPLLRQLRLEGAALLLQRPLLAQIVLPRLIAQVVLFLVEDAVERGHRLDHLRGLKIRG